MRIPNELEPLPNINIVPMIDVIFAVLAFLIMSSLFLTRADQLSVDLPEANQAIAPRQEQIVVSLDAQGRLAVDGVLTSPTELSSRIEAVVRPLNQQGTPPVIVVSADRAVSHGDVVSLMDQLQTIEGIRGLAIATQPSRDLQE